LYELETVKFHQSTQPSRLPLYRRTRILSANPKI